MYLMGIFFVLRTTPNHVVLINKAINSHLSPLRTRYWHKNHSPTNFGQEELSSTSMVRIWVTTSKCCFSKSHILFRRSRVHPWRCVSIFGWNMIGMFWHISWHILILVYSKVYLCILVYLWSSNKSMIKMWIFLVFLRKNILINKCVNLKK